jgi:hypothetical protein
MLEIMTKSTGGGAGILDASKRFITHKEKKEMIIPQ